MENELLFAGESNYFGGLSNEEELVRACPEKFKADNEWSDYAMILFYEGAETTNWKWISDSRDERVKQLSCLNGLLGTFGIKHQDKEAVAGWMLSKMLKKVPAHIARESSDC